MKLTKKQEQILTGLLLGDGCLYMGKTNKFPLLTVGRAAKDIEYLKYQADIFSNLCSDEGIIQDNKFDRKRNKTYLGYKFRTRSLDILLPYYERWYPLGVKIVPSQIELSPTVLATWFCDDGSIMPKTNRDGTKGPALKLKLSTNSFTKQEVVWLAEHLSDRFKENFKIYHDSLDWYQKSHPDYVINTNTNWYIQTYTAGAKKFFQEIKSVFPEGMERKYNIFKENLGE